MPEQWTDRQRQVILARNGNLLVSAAAGAGKTAVLVERILNLVTDEAHPVDIDRMLVVTFTKAAAAQMRERIGLALEERLAADPDNSHLQKQMTLLHHAQICTIDSFCAYVLRNYFYRIDLDPGFRVAEEGELRLMKEEVLKELLEEAFEEEDPEFLQFVEYFASGRNDDHMEELLLTLSEYAESHPDPEAWLSGCGGIYEAETLSGLQQSKPGGFLTEQVSGILEEIREDLRQARTLMEDPDGPGYYLEALKGEETVLTAMMSEQDWQQWYKILQAKKTLRLTAPRKAEGSQEKKEQAAALVKKAREAFRQIREDYFQIPPEKLPELMKLARPAAQQLIRLTVEFRRRFAAKKQEKNILDFSDLEHAALAVLTDQDGQPTDVAKKFREHFEQIMIDEYQDSNLLQECILTAIAKKEEKGKNLFMVGDVKQSIYGFRQACPQLFTDKLDSYTRQKSPNQVISLRKNFRSRKQVLYSVNLIFRHLMRQETGGIAYDEEAALYPGAEYQNEDDPAYQTEVLHFSEEIMEEGSGRRDLIEGEARMIADRIFSLTDEKKGLLIRDGGTYRTAGYRDIVILLRSRGQWAEIFVNTLMELGIPAYTESLAGFYDTREIQTILNYLALVDNERQEIPLAAVLASPIGNFSSGDLASIRVAFPEKSFCDGARAYAVYGTEESLRTRLQNFYRQLEEFRRRVPDTAIHELLWQIYDETGYYDYASAMTAGAIRQANLDMLVEQALAFEATSYRGLFHFLRYVEQIRSYQMDVGEAPAFQESMNAVRIMTVHKSKGLEFPIVFAAGLGKQFNDQDEKQLLALHREGGMGVDAVDLKTRVRFASPFKQALKRQNRLENRAEEMRILYVAMTRAREKLILTAVHKETDQIRTGEAGALTRQELASATGVWKWLCRIVGTDEKLIACRSYTREELFGTAQEENTGDGVASRTSETSMEMKPDSRDEEEGDRVWNMLKQRMDYRYPYPRQNFGDKLSVSELKRRSGSESEQWEETDLLYQTPVVSPLIPRFAGATTEKKAAERGTAYHKLLECMDYQMEATLENVKELLNRLVEEGRMSPPQAASIDCGQILTFLKSEIGRRMKRAALDGSLRREQPFVIGIPANTVYPQAAADQQLLIQGIIDAYFTEDGQLVIVDYKTDHVSREDGAARLLSRYQVQLDYYARALKQLTDLPVREALIYSFALEKEIPCQIRS